MNSIENSPRDVCFLSCSLHQLPFPCSSLSVVAATVSKHVVKTWTRSNHFRLQCPSFVGDFLFHFLVVAGSDPQLPFSSSTTFCPTTSADGIVLHRYPCAALFSLCSSFRFVFLHLGPFCTSTAAGCGRLWFFILFSSSSSWYVHRSGSPLPLSCDATPAAGDQNWQRQFSYDWCLSAFTFFVLTSSIVC